MGTVVAVALVGCSRTTGVGAVTAQSLRDVDTCLHDQGVGANDVLGRYESEPHFTTTLDRCADDAGIDAADVLGVQRDMLRADAEHLDTAATCMRGRGYPLEVEHLADGSANLGDLSRYFGPDTLDEFFDDLAACEGQPRESYPTSREVEEQRRAKEAG